MGPGVSVLSEIPGAGEGFEATVVGSLGFGREAAAGQLLLRQVILEAFAAEAAVLAGRVRASAVAHVDVPFAVHSVPSEL
jgi:hypothetical protein